MAVDKKTVARIFNAPPVDAITYLDKKVPTGSWSYQDVWERAHDQAFTAARTSCADVVLDIKTALEDAIAQGKPFAQFQKELEPVLRAKGWWGKQTVVGPNGPEVVTLGTPWRLQTIYNTNTLSAYAAGRKRQMDAVAKANPDFWPAKRYVAVRDSRTRPSHSALDGVVKPVDDPFWDTHTPPNGYNCRCDVVLLSKRQFEAAGGAYTPGKVTTRTVEINKKGDTAEVAVFTDSKGREIATDPSFSHAPTNKFEPDYSKYPKTVARQLKRDVDISKYEGKKTAKRTSKKVLATSTAAGKEAAAQVAQAAEAIAPSFVPAKTVEEAIWFARENIAPIVHFEGTSVKMLNEVNKNAFELMQKYKLEKLTWYDNREDRPGAYASAHGTILRISKKAFNTLSKAQLAGEDTIKYVKDTQTRRKLWEKMKAESEEQIVKLEEEMKRLLADYKQSEFAQREGIREAIDLYEKQIQDAERMLKDTVLHKNATRTNVISALSGEEAVRDVIVHEVGHIINDQYTRKIGGIQKRFYTDFLSDLANKRQDAIYDLYLSRKDANGAFIDGFNKISMYSAKNSQELFSEAFTLYETGRVAELPVEIADFLTAYLSRDENTLRTYLLKVK